MKLKMKWLILILAGLMIGTVTNPSTSYSKEVEKVRPAKEFYLKDLQSKKVSLSDFRGKVVLLNFFATWCPPCRQEIPELAKIYQQNKKRGLVILGISLDTDGVPFILNSFVKRMKIPYPILIGTGEVAEDYQVFGIPTTFLIDKEGKIVKRFEGVVSPIHFENALKDLLEKKS